MALSAGRLLLRGAGRAGVALGLLGAVATAVNYGLVAVVHRALAASSPSRQLSLAFAALALGKAASAYASGRVAEAHSQRSVAELRANLVDRLLAIPYARFERIGAARAYAALGSDLAMVHGALQAAAQGVINAAILVGAAAYLLYLDSRAWLALLGLAVVSALVFRAISDRARASLGKAREAHDRLFASYEAVTAGMKELKLHTARRRALLEGPLEHATEGVRQHELEAQSRYLFGQAVNQLLVLLLIGFVLFGLPLAEATRAGVVSGYVLTELYVLAPLASLLRLWPTYAAAEIALRRLDALGLALHAVEGEPEANLTTPAGFTRIELRDVSYLYEDERGRGFALGPLTLTLVPGEIVFVTGGNGAGKSTLGKLLTGLYEPNAGTLLWDGEAVTSPRRDAYRQLWSAVFSDAHLFDRLYGLTTPDLDARASELLTDLELSHAVRVKDGALSTLELSRGQRKRLALLVALLEERPLLLFDEWAADQDANGKRIFYERVLPRLKALGKTVLVISHDERFFGIGDRVLALVDGALQTAAATAQDRARSR